jgi:hypothetical protein
MPVSLNLARPGTLRRRLAIPNPFTYQKLVATCSSNWTDLETHFRKSNISLTRPRPSARGRSLTFRSGFSGRPAERAARMGRARYTLRADISECYRSIYTHSIEWALHSRATAKANLTAKGPLSLGGQLDRDVRNGQDGQTKGLPIGPDTSLLLSEVILCAIDVELESIHPATRGFCIRFMDDLEFSAQSRGEAEDVLLAWDALLNRYDLTLNPAKTGIIEGPVPPEFPWRVQLSQFNIRTSSDTIFANDIYSLFTLALDLAKHNPDDAVLSYAVRRVRPRPTEAKSWAALSNLMMAVITTDPSTLRFVSGALAWGDAQGLDLNKDSISETLNNMCFHHAPLEHGSEVAWSLSIMKDLDLTLSSDSAARIARMQDNCSLLLLFDFLARKKVVGQEPDMTAVIARAEDPLAWKSEDWLLGYECARNGWASNAYFQAQKHWAEILKLGIAFFTSSSPTPSIPATPSGAALSSDDQTAAPAPVAGPTSTVPTGDADYDTNQTEDEDEDEDGEGKEEEEEEEEFYYE